MNEEDKEAYQQAKPYLLGLVALALKLKSGWDEKFAFDVAEEFMKEFEKRNEIK
jgi:hypothetical protein